MPDDIPTSQVPPTPPAQPTPPGVEPPVMPAWRQAALSLYWFATSTHWTAILMFLLPHQARSIGGDALKGTMLGIILLTGAFVSMVVAPLFGMWSDRVRTPWGRRKPFLVVGTLGNVAALIVMAFVPATRAMLLPYILVFMAIELFNNTATAPYSALIPDVVPPAQRGSASGWMGMMSMLGNLVGAGCGLALGALGGTAGVYFVLAGIMLLGMLATVLTVHEPPPGPVEPFRLDTVLRGLAAPFTAHDFRWVFFTRFLVMMGVYTVQEFLQFYLHDVVGGGATGFAFRFFSVTLARDAAAALSFLLLALLLGAVLSSLKAGALSDRYGRKRVVYVSGVVQGIMALAFLVSRDFTAVLLTGLLFGLGYGAYLAVDWALATDVLPSEADYAKDMGLWHIAFTLPQVIAAPIAGKLLDAFQRVGQHSHLPTLGYTVIFSLAFVYFILGTVLVKRVRGAR